MSAGRVVALILGSLILILGIGLLFGGGALVGVDLGMTDDEGYLTSPSADLVRDSYAIVGEVVLEDDWIWWYRHPTMVRVRITGDAPVFVGIAPRAALDSYLLDVSYSEIEEIDFADREKKRVWTVEYDDHVGPSAPAPPADQEFWTASVEGTGTQDLYWEIEPGDWALVVMNADGSRAIDVAASVGAEAPWLLPLGLGLLAAGILLTAIGLILVLAVARQTRTAEPREEPLIRAAEAGGFPLVFKAELTEPLSPALWLVKWFLLIPHYIVLAFLWCGFVVSWIVSLFAIVFTGRYPRGLFDYNVGVMRWSWRVAFYSYEALATDAYPPFTLRSGKYPADLDVPYPGRLSPGLALVKWWLLAIPHYIIVGVFQGGAGFYQCGLVFILALFAGVALLFTGRYPKDIFRLIVGLNRWTFRVFAYVALMTDTYPPFRLEE
ncbi:MAG: DUF4389 domain-containing protein [Candidatus Bipolaricaulota bacterium]|nr:MAG: DUF4389 domain-containing protein [Candidatus Bipolaricaulota bacterium]